MKNYLVQTGPSGADFMRVKADTELEAARQAVRAGKTPLAVREASRGGWERLTLPIGERALDGESLSLFSQHLGELMCAGVTLEQSLELLARRNQGNAESTRALAERLLARIRGGAALSAALADEATMPPALIGVVQGAEQGGTLGEGLRAAGDWLERDAQLRRRVLRLLAYPALLVSVSVLSVVMILTLVIPEFAPLFLGEEARLPWVTRVVLAASNALVNHSSWVLLGLLGAVTLAYLAVRSSARLQDKIGQLAPVRLARRLRAASALTVLGTLLQNGADAATAMLTASRASDTPRFAKALALAASKLREGESVSRVFATLPDLPDTTRTLVAVGEGAGDLGRALLRAAHLLEVDTQRRIDRMLAIANPVAIILLGALVAALIAGIMLGILSINQLGLK